MTRRGQAGRAGGARKRFGQNFLVDEAVVERIIATIAPAAGERIIEIGPGREALTRPLLAAGTDLAVVEIDRDLAASLRARHPRLEVVESDALDVDFAALSGARPYRLVGNLPYNISTPLLFHLFAQTPQPTDMHFMLQKEVVDRLTAEPGTRAQGRLGLMCRNLATVTHLFDVPPEAFDPRPKVNSAVVKLCPRNTPRVPERFAATFDELVRRAFAQRRKTLRNSLRGRVDAATLEAAGVDPGARPESLALEDFLALARAVEQPTADPASL